MDTGKLQESITLPEGVTATVNNADITITGSEGSVTRAFLHPRIKIILNDGIVIFDASKSSKNEKKIIKTFAAHLKNLFKGVTEGHTYKLKICSGHFPMNVSVKGLKLVVKNFIGEAVPRTLLFKEGATVKVEGDIIIVTGINKEIVAQAAASVEQLTRRVGFDRRIFQDGIYIVEKDGKSLS